MMKYFATLVTAATLTLSACSHSVPVNGRFNGEPAQGTATASLNGGTFQVLNTSGMNCKGTYDAFDTSITITGEVTCNDGRYGTVIITRKSTLTSGTAIVRLNDGTTGEFVFGDLQFDSEF